MNTQILPLAITMVAGPQIMSAIIFVTSDKAVKLSVAFIIGAAIGVTAGVIVMKSLVAVSGIDLGDPSDSGSTGSVIQYVLVALLAAAMLRNYIRRATIEPPKWLGGLLGAEPRKAFVLGLLLLSIFPSDALILLTVGTNLEHHSAPISDAWAFVGVTTLLLALPLLGFLLFHRRAVAAMPKVRDWMSTNSWLVNIIVCAIFIVLIFP